jgi:CDP-diacylglycerol--glycerol-3-phosphate 3-phosphatidyltransferase
MTTLAGVRKTLAFHITRPVVRVLARTGVTPNGITWFGVFVAGGAAALIGTGHPFAGGLVMLFAGLCDILDGALARTTGRTSTFGGVLDSVLDRLGESAVLLGLIVYYSGLDSTVGVVVTGLVWITSLLVSYVRARAEAAGLDCQVGLFTRAERVVVLALGLLLSQFGNILLIALYILAVLRFVTVVQRSRHVWRQTAAR